MRNFLTAALLGLGIGSAIAAPARAVDIGCLFQTADDARPCGYDSCFCSASTEQADAIISDGIVIDLAEARHLGATPQAERWLAQSGAVYQPIGDRAHPASRDWTKDGVAIWAPGQSLETPLADDGDNGDATCSAPGTDRYSVIRSDSGAGPTWLMTNDTRNCSQAGVNDPVFKPKD